MLIYSRVLRVLHPLVLLVSLSAPLHAQTIDDGLMMGKHDLLTGNHYSHESWDRYWEGTLQRVNGNIGTITTKTNIWSANYGITDRLNVIAMVPYVWTGASQGVLHGIQGFQDITLAGKYDFFATPTHYGALRAIAVVSVGIPLADYNPELPPLSIGSGSKRVSGRFTAYLQSDSGWFLNGSTAYTWRAQVALDRPYYFTDDQFVMSDHVDMPSVFDDVVSGGYLKRGLMAAVALSQQRTLGGGDIRRQDMPFLSNRMNFSKVGAMLVYPIPKINALGFEFAYGYIFDGRNVGQATTLMTGLRYGFQGGPTR
jgi:Putative MetA-pathway of phenol degradation